MVICPQCQPQSLRNVLSLLCGLALLAALGAIGLNPPWLDAAAQTPAPGKPRPAHPQQARIDAAIAKGVDFLKRSQDWLGTWSEEPNAGSAALGGWALLESGVPADDPVVKKAAAYVRGAPFPPHTYTYIGSLGILFLDRLGNKKDKQLLRNLAGRLLVGQNQGGAWTYNCAHLTPPQLDTLLESLRTRSPAAPYPLPLAIPGLKPEVGKEDNSNTQFALLGLWAGRRHGVPADDALRAAAKRLAASPNQDGGWGYNRDGVPSSSTPAMTCAGLLGLAMGHGLALPPDAKKTLPTDPRISSGLKFLGKSLHDETNLANLYFLWSLERVGELYQLKTIGNKDWYDLGARFLLDAQKGDGAWSVGNYPGSSPALDTCFALLFLKRSNPVRDLTDQLLQRIPIADPDARASDGSKKRNP